MPYVYVLRNLGAPRIRVVGRTHDLIAALELHNSLSAGMFAEHEAFERGESGTKSGRATARWQLDQAVYCEEELASRRIERAWRSKLDEADDALTLHRRIA